MTPYVAIVVTIQAIFFLRWLYKRARTVDVSERFVSDMATNHLPHVYQALRQICDKMGIEFKEPPPIQFVDFKE